MVFASEGGVVNYDFCEGCRDFTTELAEIED